LHDRANYTLFYFPDKNITLYNQPSQQLPFSEGIAEKNNLGSFLSAKCHAKLAFTALSLSESIAEKNNLGRFAI